MEFINKLVFFRWFCLKSCKKIKQTVKFKIKISAINKKYFLIRKNFYDYLEI